MDYPPLIYLDATTEQDLIQYINTELTNHYMERSRYIKDLEDMQHSYWAEPSDEEVTFPFHGASKIVIPLNAIAVEAIHSRTMTTLFGMDQLITAKATNPEWQQVVKPVEDFFNKELKDNVKVRRPVNDATLECEKYGTGCLKSGFVKVVKTAVREIEGKRESFQVVTKQGATLDAVPMARFLMPFAELDEQMSSWCGEEHSKTPHQIQLLEQGGLFYEGTWEKIRYSLTNSGPYGEREFERSQEQLERREIAIPSLINFQELWMAWNVDGNDKGERAEIVVFYQKESNTIMSIRYNWYDDLHRPYRKGVYFPIEHRWTGIGIIKQNNQFQEEITTKHRQFLDNATMANMRMLKVSKLSGIQPDEPVFPGKMWFLDDMSHVESIQMGEVYPSAYNSEQSSLMYSQQRTGVNELTLGQPQAGTPGTAADTLSRIQEGNKKYGFTFANMKEMVSAAYLDVMANIAQFGPKNITYFENAEDGQLVEQFLQMPVSSIREGLIIDLGAAGQLENKLIDRQNSTQLGQLFNQYITGILQLATQTQDPNIIHEVVSKGIFGGTEIMRQILETFDVKNIERILVNERGLNAGGMGGAAQPSQTAGMVDPTQVGALLPRSGV